MKHICLFIVWNLSSKNNNIEPIFYTVCLLKDKIEGNFLKKKKKSLIFFFYLSILF